MQLLLPVLAGLGWVLSPHLLQGNTTPWQERADLLQFPEEEAFLQP